MVNYPSGHKPLPSNNQKRSLGSRGMDFEKDINDSCTYYKEINRALIYKKPTPIQVVKVDYPNRQHAKITEAYYKIPSTTDYNGIYKGKYVDFEAKETRNKTLFTMQNVHAHQIEHLEKVQAMGGIAFLLIRFAAYEETYLLDASYVVNAHKEGKKSLTYTFIKTHGHLIENGYLPRLKFLDVVDSIYFKEE